MRHVRIFTFLLAILVFTSCSLAFGSPTIAVSPSSLTANSTLAYGCGSIPANQNIAITNSGSGTLSGPTISATYSQGSGWLNWSLSGSGNSYTLAVSFQNLCISAGTYNATIKIASSGATNTPVSVPVKLVISSSGTPTISLSPTSLSFSATVGGSNPSAQSVSVSNSGGGTLASPTTSITYGSGSGWLSVNCTGSSAPYSCSTQPTTGSLAAGTYTATVKVTSSGASNSPQSYSVSFAVSSGSACVMTVLNNTADCGPYDYAPDTETTVAQTVVGQGAWNASAAPGMTETTTVTNPGDWNSVINISGNPGDAVITYPSIGQYYNGESLSSFSAMYSGYNFSVDTSSNDSVDVGHDIWLNNWANEIMIQPYIVNRGGQCGPVLATETFGGTNGVPTNTWVLCQYGSEIIWQIKQPSGNPSTFGFTHGSVDILSMLNWLVDNGYLPSTNTFTEIGFGFEVCYTNGQNLTYSISNYSLTDN